MRAEETVAIAALIQATAAKLWKLHESNLDFRQYSRALLMENKFRAVRYGLEGKLIDFGKQEEVPERDLILEYLPSSTRWWMSWIRERRSNTSATMLKRARCGPAVRGLPRDGRAS